MADKIATREAYGKALVDLGNENGKVWFWTPTWPAPP